jgi:hypothetical protein
VVTTKWSVTLNVTTTQCGHICCVVTTKDKAIARNVSKQQLTENFSRLITEEYYNVLASSKSIGSNPVNWSWKLASKPFQSIWSNGKIKYRYLPPYHSYHHNLTKNGNVQLITNMMLQYWWKMDISRLLRFKTPDKLYNMFHKAANWEYSRSWKFPAGWNV